MMRDTLERVCAGLAAFVVVGVTAWLFGARVAVVVFLGVPVVLCFAWLVGTTILGRVSGDADLLPPPPPPRYVGFPGPEQTSPPTEQQTPRVVG
jgi:hypothetical protein